MIAAAMQRASEVQHGRGHRQSEAGLSQSGAGGAPDAGVPEIDEEERT
jgi:hypothetical protein